jgi:hypothetical protein
MLDHPPRIIFFATVFADPVNLESVAGSNVAVFLSNFLFQAIHLGREEFDRTAAFGANHVMVTATIVLMLVAGDAIVKRDFTGQTALSQQLQRSVYGRKAYLWILFLHQPVQFVSREMLTSFQESAQNSIALRRMFQSYAFEMPVQDAFGLTNHLARDGGLIVNAFLHHDPNHDKWTTIRIILAFQDTANHFAGLSSSTATT